MPVKHVLVAPEREKPEFMALPYIFLAGPIVGAVRWQDEAIAHLQEQPVDVVVCNPRREVDRMEDFHAALFAEQVDWETLNLNIAQRQGCILFWLAKESVHQPGRAYAQTSRFELGERHHAGPDKVVIGIEPGFSGDRYIRHRLEPMFEIENDLARTCQRAAATAARRQQDRA